MPAHDSVVARRWLGSYLLLVCLFTAGNARAATPVAVYWLAEGPQAHRCLEPQAVIVSVEAALGRQVFAPLVDANVLLRVEAERAAPLEVVLSLWEPGGAALGQRRLVVDRCAELNEVAALTLSLMLDFNVAEIPNKKALNTNPGVLAPAPVETAPVEQGASPKRAEMPGVSSSRRTSFPVSGLVLLGIGGTPAPVLGGQLSVALELRRRLTVQFIASLLASDHFSRRGTQLKVQTMSAGVAVCPLELSQGPWVGQVCMPAILGRVEAGASEGLAEVTSGSDVFFSLGLSAQIERKLGAFGVVARVAGLVPLVNYRVTARDGAALVALFVPASVTFEAGLGLTWHAR